MNLQALVDGMSAQWMKDRAETQMTLSAMIERLRSLPDDAKVPMADAHSYRSYYSDLCFEPSAPVPASELLAECEAAMGQCFQGYKGGDYYMHAGVPCWVAYEGRCGKKLIAINDDGSLVTAEDEG